MKLLSSGRVHNCGMFSLFFVVWKLDEEMVSIEADTTRSIVGNKVHGLLKGS